MSHQVCHCGWSKVTTYQGLRTHQGMMGCTPKGMGIPESQQFIFNGSLPKPAYPGPLMAKEPLMNINTPAFKPDEKLHSSGSQRDIWWSLLAGVHQGDGGSFNRSTPGKTESGSGRLGAAALDVLVKDGAPPTTTAQELFGPNEKQKEKERQTQQLQKAGQLQVCHCGWSEVTTYHGLRTHQGMMGCTPKGMGIPESQQFIFNGSLPKPANPGPLMADEPLMNINTPAFKSDEKLHSSGSQQDIWGVHQGDGGSFSRTTPVKTESGSVRLRAAALDALVKETNEWAFQTPPPCATTHQAPARQAPVRACRALDFNTSAQQVTGQLFWAPPTTTAQETFGPNERQKERETQQLQKVRQDRTRADLQHDIQTRERKMAEVRSSVKACKGGLDAEWLEINNVFAGVMRAVEGARRKALGPLEERRKKVKKEAELLVQRLQKEIDKLKMTIDELETDPELKVSSQTGLTDTDAVNTSSSFGSLRTTTSNMMEEIHQELEKLSSVELKRISTFAVDVKLDPATAHPGLLLSPDGKSARDGGDHQKVPDGPQRFDVFGSVVGLGALPPGRSYWEVEVGDKTGWDLGVARRDARRKGRLSLDPANGYWVAVHFEGEKYAAMAAPPVMLPLTRRPRRVGVFVDRAEGLVSFYDAAAKSHMYSFVGCAFGGEVLPYFSPHLRQNGENSGPLSLPAVAVVA